MAVKKRQHYVPKFYLKYFSLDEKRLNIVNLKSKKIIPLGGLKEQCYKNYFYGKDLIIENLLGDFETISSEVLLNIITNEETPKIDSKNYTILLYFLVLQLSRTKASSNSWTDMFTNLNKSIGEEVVQLNGDPVLLAMSLSSNSFPLYSDLSLKLVINKTNEEFVLSDNPVVEYNQFFENRRFSSNTGMQSKGLQLFLPLTSKLMLLAYDRSVYKVGHKRDGYLIIKDKSNIVNINLLQFLNSEKNIYFTDVLSSDNLNEYFHKLKKYKRESLNTSKEVKFINENTQEQSKGLHLKKTDIKTNLRIEGISVKKKARIWLRKYNKQKSQDTALARTLSLYEKLQNFNALVEAGKLRQESIMNYFDLPSCPELHNIIKALQ